MTWQIHKVVRHPLFRDRDQTGICGGGKAKRIRRKKNEQEQPNLHMMPGPVIRPGPHWWGAIVLTSGPPFLPIKVFMISASRQLVWAFDDCESTCIVGMKSYLADKKFNLLALDDSQNFY